MRKKYHFEQIRLYAILSFIFMSLMYIVISSFNMPLDKINFNHYFFGNLIFFGTCNLIRYRYFSTTKYNQNWLFLVYGCIDLFTVSFYFATPALDQGGKLVILFILIIASIYRGRKTGLILTLAWLPMKILSDFIFMHLLRKSGESEFQKMFMHDRLVEILYFQILLLILVFITEAIYREIADKEKENNRLLHELASQYQELNAAHDEIETKNDRLKKANAELFTLQQVSKTITSILEIDELMNYVNDITLGVIGVKTSTIILFNEKSSKLEVHTTNITDKRAYTILCNNINCQELLSILEGETAILDNNVDSNKFSFAKGRDVCSLMCVPITSKLKKFGLILVEQDFKNAFDANKTKLLTVIAHQVGMAMENVDLYYKMHELAIKDNLTGAYNRLYFHERLENELMNAKTNHYSFALAILDIDYFKKFNDNYGHLFGDKVLKTITEIIKKSIRSNDVIARFGGEEFIILFPRTPLTKAYEIVEKLRKKIASTTISDGSVDVSITASFGVTSFPENASNITELIKDADDSLYKAKESGRNCVKISEKYDYMKKAL